ncbi:MAG: 4-alpha-glucanotransferase [Clostridia bacterium]|nr:4-alpha-glucanotransferase [Clostridia bacterium]
MKEENRQAGVLLPVSALPSPYGIGCFSDEAYRFIDMLASAGQSVWQILPLCPTSFGDSPYQSPCSFGGNPYFISLDALVSEGLLDASDLPERDGAEYVDYKRLYEERYPILRRAYARFAERGTSDGYTAFCAENSLWLEDYALFMAIKNSLGGAPLSDFPIELLQRDASALYDARRSLSYETGFWRFLQYEFFTQWSSVRAYANKNGVRILGDIPIYVSADSSDVWTRPELFELDKEGKPLTVAGCPPDGFSPKGQLWGNPVYRWSEHKKEGFRWWTDRIAHAFSMYDTVRIDHFRGFDAYYSIPFGDEDATGGYWRNAPGEELFAAVRERLGEKDIIAEDLGYMTEGVRRLLRACGFSGMKILQFGFDGGGDFSSEYLPHNYSADSVVYTGTHDNPTLAEWIDRLSSEENEKLGRYFCADTSDKKELARHIISAAMQSPSRLCVIPMQDYLSVGKEGRMNTPASASGNWAWRMKKEDISASTAAYIREISEPYGRIAKNRALIVGFT